MRKSELCPKCESSFIGVMDGVVMGKAPDGSRGNITVPTAVYLCRDCGFFEEYLATLPEDRQTTLDSQVKIRWLREPPEQKGPYR